MTTKIPDWQFGRSEMEQEMCQDTHDATVASIRFHVDELARYYHAMASSCESCGNHSGADLWSARELAMRDLSRQLANAQD